MRASGLPGGVTTVGSRDLSAVRSLVCAVGAACVPRPTNQDTVVECVWGDAGDVRALCAVEHGEQHVGGASRHPMSLTRAGVQLVRAVGCSITSSDKAHARPTAQLPRGRTQPVAAPSAVCALGMRRS